MSEDDRVEQIRERAETVAEAGAIVQDDYGFVSEFEAAAFTMANSDIPYLLERLQAAEERVEELERKLASIHADADSELDMKGGPYKNGVSAASKRASALRRIRGAAREALREDNHD